MRSTNDPTQDAWILDALVDEAMQMGYLCQLEIEANTDKPGTFCIVTRNRNTITGFWPDEPELLKLALTEDAEVAAIMGISDGKYIARLRATTRDNALTRTAIMNLSGAVGVEAAARITACETSRQKIITIAKPIQPLSQFKLQSRQGL